MATDAIKQFRGPPSAMNVSRATELRVAQAKATYNRGYADGYAARGTWKAIGLAWVSGLATGFAAFLIWQAVR